tara:strand:- start:22166 stop:22819 length:654 start_codon:yes stop_codon:yes gene_type:complete
MKILNLYAGIGGNRRGWGDEHEIVAVEYDEEIAKAYKKHFPNDEVIVGDALEYVLNNYNNFDFIWASPPCPSHSSLRFNLGYKAGKYGPIIPEMTSLYGLITFLQHHYEGGWAIENVIPYYEPLITPTATFGRHHIWSSFPLHDVSMERMRMNDRNDVETMTEWVGFDITDTKIKNKRKVLRNCTDEGIGDMVLYCFLNNIRSPNQETLERFYEREE